MKKIYYFILFVVVPLALAAGEKKPQYFSIDIYGGYSIGLYGFNAQNAGKVDKNNLAASTRVMWEPGHILGIGFETGFYRFSVLNNSEVRAELNGVPMFLVLSHDLKYLKINAGVGYLYMYSLIDGFGYRSTSSVFEFGYMVSVSSSYRFTDMIGLTGEIKFMNRTENEKSTLALLLGANVRI